MNKKIISICALLLVVISISAVSAFDLGDLFGTNEKTVNVNGVDFILPDGFKEDTTNTSKEATSALKDLGLNVTVKIYTNGSSAVGFYVSNYTSLGLKSDVVLNTIGGNPTTVKNVTGLMKSENGANMFSYTQGDYLILINTNNKDLINQVIKD